ncbi:pilus assembly protein TadE [Amycolatopsis sp. K13G38]|uniref:Pilus assembly protein TadE n=1 Tax=Amycolatopsis acididurans TaxID=2724524 RepID=A0ABX1J6Z5_9PSEU|nr:pilus assembly protein TadE [Amycolatopsis acididurans]
MAARSGSRRARDRLRRLRRDEQGSVTAELVLAVPALLLLLLVIAQFAVWAHAQHIAQAAASQALSAARVQGGSNAGGHTQADSVLTQLGNGPLRNPQAAVVRGPEQSTVDISGEAATVVPFLHLPVRARAAGPTERFVTPEVGG